MPDFDATVIGAGAVGLACGAALAAAGQSVLVLEAESHPGAGISSRNSEVIHAGLYYPTGSLKHLLCIRGRRKLYAFLASHGVAHRKCGKLVVATSADETAAIERIAARAAENGVENTALISAAALRAREPHVRGHAALLSPETGIFDSHGYLLALEAEIAAAGGLIAYRSPFVAAEPAATGFAVTTGGAEPARFTTARLVNSAGLAATTVAARIAGLAPADIPPLRLAKGSYFGLRGRSPFSGLIYPAPTDGGLGVHATLDLAGRTRFGPDVEWLPAGAGTEALDHAVDLARAEGFYAAVRRYWPALPDGALFADYAGIRPKLSGPGAPAADFRIDGPEAHGLAGLVNLFGIESPGLTASLAIAEEVLARLA
jgi:L-2-hydroxyglutarate oxidase LhgO